MLGSRIHLESYPVRLVTRDPRLRRSGRAIQIYTSLENSWYMNHVSVDLGWNRGTFGELDQATNCATWSVNRFLQPGVLVKSPTGLDNTAMASLTQKEMVCVLFRLKTTQRERTEIDDGGRTVATTIDEAEQSTIYQALLSPEVTRYTVVLVPVPSARPFLEILSPKGPTRQRRKIGLN